MSDHSHRWSPTGLPFGWSFILLRRHVAEKHPGIHAHFANWYIAELHREEHGVPLLDYREEP